MMSFSAGGEDHRSSESSSEMLGTLIGGEDG